MPKHPKNRRLSQAEFTLAILSIKKADVTLLTGKRRMLILLSIQLYYFSMNQIGGSTLLSFNHFLNNEE